EGLLGVAGDERRQAGLPGAGEAEHPGAVGDHDGDLCVQRAPGDPVDQVGQRAAGAGEQHAEAEGRGAAHGRRRASTSAGVRPATSTTLSRAVSPQTRVSERTGSASAAARTSRRRSFARPRSGGARTATFSAAPGTPTIRSTLLPGAARTLKRAPRGLAVTTRPVIAARRPGAARRGRAGAARPAPPRPGSAGR